MIHLAGPYVVAALLVGLGVMGVLVRRNAVLLLIGVELILSGSLVLLVASGATSPSRWEASSVLPLFVITIAAAEVVVAPRSSSCVRPRGLRFDSPPTFTLDRRR